MRNEPGYNARACIYIASRARAASQVERGSDLVGPRARALLFARARAERAAISRFFCRPRNSIRCVLLVMRALRLLARPGRAFRVVACLVLGVYGCCSWSFRYWKSCSGLVWWLMDF